MGSFVVIAGILILVVVFYILTYYLNSKTDAPEGAEAPSCETCNSKSCSLRKKDGPIDPEECEIEQDK